MKPGDLVRLKCKGTDGSDRQFDELVVCLDPRVRRVYFVSQWIPCVFMLTLGGDTRNFPIEYWDFEVIHETR